MTVYVVDLLTEVNAVRELNVSGSVSGFDYLGEHIEFDGDVTLLSSIKRVQSKHYEINGTVKLTAILRCGRCMRYYKYDAEFPVELCFVNKQKAIDDELDCYYTDGDTVELDEAIQTNLIMNIPTERLCSETCKGLCPVCGADLNNECCGCVESGNDSAEDEGIDQRFAALKDFFEK